MRFFYPSTKHTLLIKKAIKKPTYYQGHYQGYLCPNCNNNPPTLTQLPENFWEKKRQSSTPKDEEIFDKVKRIPIPFVCVNFEI